MAIVLAAAAGPGRDRPGPDAAVAAAAPPPPDPEVPIYEEQVVVTASKVEQQLVNAPATVSVVTADVIQSSPATNYAELLRSVPGMNITQTSARDFNINMRGATSTLATSQLALIDGRSLYLDFFGFVAWDFLPVNPNELRQIEVIRGPASAVWGANALSGVVNFITKTPRELAGTSFTMGVGTFGREVDDNGRGNGSLWYMNGTHAAAANDRWSYKVSAGWFTQDAMARPEGTIDNALNTPYPAFANTGTSQPKFDGRVDYDAPEGAYRLSFAGGFAGTEGIIHTGIGPFDMNSGTVLGYGSARWTKGAQKVSFFTNILNGDANALLSVGLDGQPILFEFNTKTFDIEYGNVNTLGTRNVLSYGGNFRYNSLRPVAGAARRQPHRGRRLHPGRDLHQRPPALGGRRAARQVQRARRPELLAAHRVHRQAGARSRGAPVVQPRLPRPVAHQQLPRRRHRQPDRPARDQPGLRRRAGRPVLHLPVRGHRQRGAGRATGGRLRGGLHRRHRQAGDGDRGLLLQRVEGRHLLHADRPLPGLEPAARLGGQARAAGRSGAVAGHPRGPAAALPVAAAAVHVGRPAVASSATSTSAPCATRASSWASTRRSTARSTSLPTTRTSSSRIPTSPSPRSTCRRPTASTSASATARDAFSATLNVTYQDEAFWQDVLDARFHGPTEAFTQVNGAFGMRWMDDKLTTTLKVINLFDEEIQSHVFGDVLKRQVIGELRVQF